MIVDDIDVMHACVYISGCQQCPYQCLLLDVEHPGCSCSCQLMRRVDGASNATFLTALWLYLKDVAHVAALQGHGHRDVQTSLHSTMHPGLIVMMHIRQFLFSH